MMMMMKTKHILHLLLINLSVCNKLLTIENIWKKHLSVWSHVAIKTNNFFQAIKFKVAPWLERLSMKVVSSCAMKDINFFKSHTYLNPKKKTWNSSNLYRDSSWPFVLPMSHFNNMSGQTNWCLTFSNCSEIIVDPSINPKA